MKIQTQASINLRETAYKLWPEHIKQAARDRLTVILKQRQLDLFPALLAIERIEAADTSQLWSD